MAEEYGQGNQEAKLFLHSSADNSPAQIFAEMPWRGVDEADFIFEFSV
jgi:hypothetical protein